MRVRKKLGTGMCMVPAAITTKSLFPRLEGNSDLENISGSRTRDCLKSWKAPQNLDLSQTARKPAATKGTMCS